MSSLPPSAGPRPKLGEILVKTAVLTRERLDDALKFQAETKLRIGECLVRLGYVRDEDVVRAVARQSGMPFVDVRKGVIPPETLAKVPKDVALDNNILPVKFDGAAIVLAVTDPLAAFNLEHLRFLLGIEFKCALTTEEAMLEGVQALLQRREARCEHGRGNDPQDRRQRRRRRPRHSPRAADARGRGQGARLGYPRRTHG
jgi:hypothetical protein